MNSSMDVAFYSKPVMSAAMQMPVREDILNLSNRLNMVAGEMKEINPDLPDKLIG